MDFVGIDYGSKLAGTTVICYTADGEMAFLQSAKGKDADAMIEDFVKTHNPGLIFIDAPLSLPEAYFNENASDYFYRQCDREVKAMSPMFLGGLTARAIKLKNKPLMKDILFYESYPRGLVDELCKTHPMVLAEYKKNLRSFTQLLSDIFNLEIKTIPGNWHQADAMLAYFIGHRFSNNQHLSFGKSREGLIYV